MNEFKRAEAGRQTKEAGRQTREAGRQPRGQLAKPNEWSPKGWGQALGSGNFTPAAPVPRPEHAPIYVSCEAGRGTYSSNSTTNPTTCTSPTGSAVCNQSTDENQMDEALRTQLVEEMTRAHDWVDADLVKVRPSPCAFSLSLTHIYTKKKYEYIYSFRSCMNDV